MYQFYGWETASPFVRKLYDDLLQCWCAETCAPRMIGDRSTENPTLGQCSITSFLVQDSDQRAVRRHSARLHRQPRAAS